MDELANAVETLRLFSDPTRLRLAILLDDRELTVAEITRVTGLPQSGVSTHLGKLRQAGAVRDRPDGTSTYYTLNSEAMPEPVRRVWSIMTDHRDSPLVREDCARCAEVLQQRQKAGTWAESVAGQMDRHYSPGRTWEATVLGLLSYVHLGDVLDVGAGDGTMAQVLAPRCKSMLCLDLSPKLLAAAKQRLAKEKNVRFLRADFHTLPLPDQHVDHVLLLHVLTFAHDPLRVVREAARVLRRGGNLLISTLASHEHADVTAPYGHVNQGFRPQTLRTWLSREAHLEVERCEVTSHEKKPPHFAVITAFARKTAAH
jgi:ArsR family transcriptional regulator